MLIFNDNKIIKYPCDSKIDEDITKSYSKCLLYYISPEIVSHIVENGDVNSIETIKDKSPSSGLKIARNIRTKETKLELILLKSFILYTPLLFEFFDSELRSADEKEQLINQIFPDLSYPVRALLKLLKERNEFYYLPYISDFYEDLLLKYKKITFINLILGCPFDAQLSPFFVETLKKITGSIKVRLLVSYDSTLLGGLIIEYDSNLINLTTFKEISDFFFKI